MLFFFVHFSQDSYIPTVSLACFRSGEWSEYLGIQRNTVAGEMRESTGNVEAI
jgi:hypothetical protein